MCSCLLLRRSSFKNVKHSREKVGLKIHSGKTKILSSQGSSRRKEIEIDNIKVDILTREETTKYLGQMVYIPATGDDRDQESNQGCQDDIIQMQTRADLQIVPSSTSASLIRHGDHPNVDLRLRTLTHSKEHEKMLPSSQRKMLRLFIKTKRKFKKNTGHT